jgi:hypothetical protein
VAKNSSYSLDYGRALLEELCRIPLVEFGLAALEKGARVVLHQPVGTAVVATTVALASIEPLRAVRALGGVALGGHVGGGELSSLVVLDGVVFVTANDAACYLE